MVAALKAFVIGAGILLVFGTALLVLLVVQRERAPAEAEVTGLVHHVELPGDARVAQMIVDGPRLILLLQSRGGSQSIAVIDTRTGERVSLIQLRPTS